MLEGPYQTFADWAAGCELGSAAGSAATCAAGSAEFDCSCCCFHAASLSSRAFFFSSSDSCLQHIKLSCLSINDTGDLVRNLPN